MCFMAGTPGNASRALPWLFFRTFAPGVPVGFSLTTTSGVQYSHGANAVGYNSSIDKRVHFGLGDATLVERVELRWPNGQRQTLSGIKPDPILNITHGR
jgi:hypothetical protein